MAVIGSIAVPHPPLIVPAVGRGEQRRIQDTIDAYGEAVGALMGLKPDAIVVTSPHAPMFRDAFHVTTDEVLDGDMRQFRASQERIHAECDVELAEEVVARAAQAGLPVVDSRRYREEMDHGTYVPLYFVREWYRATRVAGTDAEGDLPCPIVRIGLSGLSPQMHRALGRVIAQAADALGRRVAFVASGDLSHKLLVEGPYGFAPEGPVFDAQIGEIFASGDLERLFAFDEAFCDAAAECGLRSFQIMAGAIEGLGFKSRMLSNEGPFGVGYGVATCLPCGGEGEGLDAAAAAGTDERDSGAAGATGAGQAASAFPEVDPYVALARLSVETYVRTGRRAELPPDVDPALLEQRAGAFVSLHEHGELRGCIGTIAATCDSVAEEILRNGISACSRDPRFDPVREDELDALEYSVDVLGDAEPISSPAELDPRRFGVIVTQGWKRGLLLPNLDGVDTVEAQLSIAKRKAGIDPFDDRVSLERFEVVRHTRGGEPRA